MTYRGKITLTLVVLLLSAATAAPEKKKPARNPIASFFSNVISYIQNGISSLFGAEGRSASNGRVSYRGFQLLRATPRTPDQLLEMRGLEEEFEGVSFWRAPRAKNISADIQVPPTQVASVKSFFRERQIDFEVLSQDLQNMIAQQNPKMNKERRDQLRDVTGHSMTWRRFHRYVGTHAREWISPAVATYILKQLIENADVNRHLLDNFDWYILPVVNPDGYEYSHTTDRMWRKTRSSIDDDDEEISRGSRIARVFFGSCEGVDPNRNWDHHWGERGASDDSCDETYAGPRAFSEPETRAIADFILARRSIFKVFLTLHSYGQMWLMPWGYTSDKLADHDDLMRLGQEAVAALTKVQGTEYSVGAADDWAKGVAGIKYAYTVELRDKGDSGFLLPASQIIPTGKETFAAIKAMAKSLMPVKAKKPKPPQPRPPNNNKFSNTTTPKPKPNKQATRKQNVTTAAPIHRGRGRISL
ncbi:hypothetical protein B566_EDAN002943 [Ephemera danica]|nr:hypothetical protein B566_EDAN002943 [Ephemera danica]